MAWLRQEALVNDKNSVQKFVTLSSDESVWERFFTVAPLVLIGTREADGGHDIAPKHMALQLGWDAYFGFVCTPQHATYRNAKREGAFTVSYPRPSQILLTSLAAAPRCDDGTKPSLDALSVMPAKQVDGVLVEDAYAWLECQTVGVWDDFGDHGLVVGRVMAAHVADSALRMLDRDDQELINGSPLLVYLNPGRYAEISSSHAFPFSEVVQG